MELWTLQSCHLEGVVIEISKLRSNLSLIAIMGGAMLIVGTVLYLLAGPVSNYMRFLLPLPPISVAAYIYVQNKISLPETSGETPRATLKDLLTETVFGTLLFGIIAGLLLLGFAILPATVYPDAVRTNLLLIALMGGAMLIVGAVLYGIAARLRPYGRFLLPLPPISVGAYIYVLNKVNLPEALVGQANLKDFLIETVVGGVFFFIISALILRGFQVFKARITMD